MGHVLFAAPPIARFRLIESMQRSLLIRGHRVSVTVHDPVTRRCFEAQGMPVAEIAPTRGPIAVDPAELAAAAARDRRLAGRPERGPRLPSSYALRRRLAGVLRWCEREMPDLVVICDDRSGISRLTATVARAAGADVLHLGPGPLAGLIQRDDFGLDGDSSSASRPAIDYRDVRADRAFLHAAVAALLGGEPVEAARGLAVAPDWYDRLAAIFEAGLQVGFGTGWSRLAAWRLACADAADLAFAPPAEPPPTPHVLVLLEPADDPRVRLDGGGIGPQQLLAAVPDAVQAVLPEARVVAAANTDPRRRLALEVGHGGALRAPDPALVATAAAVVTITHPMAALALLTDTPVCHFGSTPWAVPGATRRTTLATLADDLAAVLATSATRLRERAATRLFRDEHVWCDPDRPDPNGVRGLVEDVERRLAARLPCVAERRYRPGPAWPLMPGVD